MRANFTLVEEAAERFVAVMLPADKARIGSFSNRIQVDPRDSTSDHDELVGILRTELQPEGPTSLADELHRQYALGFTPMTLDGKMHTLEVRVPGTGMTARARKSYLARNERQSGLGVPDGGTSSPIATFGHPLHFCAPRAEKSRGVHHVEPRGIAKRQPRRRPAIICSGGARASAHPGQGTSRGEYREFCVHKRGADRVGRPGR